MKRTGLIRAMGLTLAAGSMSFALSAHAAPGLYSAEDLLDSDVYDSTGEENLVLFSALRSDWTGYAVEKQR